MNDPLIFLAAIALVCLSALCSGLNVALLTLNLRDLELKAESGDPWAIRALPIRIKVHFYLSGILLANVAFASATSVVLNSALSGVVAVAISTVALVVFAEITPQAFAVRAAAPAVGLFAPAIRLVSYLGYPLTKPIALLLDKLVGEGRTELHTRRELSLLIADHLDEPSELDENEVEIVQSALKLSETRVKEVMTPLKKVTSVSGNASIDEVLFQKLKDTGRSRIPVMQTKNTSTYQYLLMRDLFNFDFSKRPYTVSELPKHRTKAIGSLTALDTLFQQFIGSKKHLIFIEKDSKVVGILTIEDLIEAAIGHEIEDETDL